MSILVTNCFHWMNYHLVNELIENGYTVAGMGGQMTKEKEHLSMLIGRNSLFSLITDQELEQYQTVIGVGETDDTIDTRRFIMINHEGQQADLQKNRTFIQTPILFGEWMPMDQKGAYINDTYITFESPEFLATAIYIKDFIHYLLTCIKEKHLPEKITIQSSRNVESGEVLLDKSVYIQDNIPIEKTVNKVRNHYEQFKAYYKGR